MTGRPSPLVVVALAIVLAACGGRSERDALVSSLSDSIIEDPTFEDYEVTEDEADCVAERAVEEIGADRLGETGIGDGDQDADLAGLEDAEIVVLGDAMDECIADSRAVLVDAVAAGILEEPVPAFPVTEPEATCVAEDVVDSLGFSRLIVIGLQAEREGGDQFAVLEAGEIRAFTDAFADCIDVRTILLDDIAADGVSDDVLACLDANITEQDIDALLLAGFSGEDSAAAAERALDPVVEACT